MVSADDGSLWSQDAVERANSAENDAQSLRNKAKLLEQDVKKAEERADLLEVRYNFGTFQRQGGLCVR